ncbi:hypothetical protein [Ruegeria faecimaris]|uniref:hypothetical protein n=1 Tax=Ruegeria faecimaris TaxID=686389 RepID=UPI002490586F|nr:hypothetical protein [Ruegeria faecimaris]
MELLELFTFLVVPENWFWWIVLGSFWLVFSVMYAVLGGPFGWVAVVLVVASLSHSAHRLWNGTVD